MPFKQSTKHPGTFEDTLASEEFVGLEKLVLEGQAYLDLLCWTLDDNFISSGRLYGTDSVRKMQKLYAEEFEKYVKKFIPSPSGGAVWNWEYILQDTIGSYYPLLHKTYHKLVVKTDTLHELLFEDQSSSQGLSKRRVLRGNLTKVEIYDVKRTLDRFKQELTIFVNVMRKVVKKLGPDIKTGYLTPSSKDIYEEFENRIADIKSGKYSEKRADTWKNIKKR